MKHKKLLFISVFSVVLLAFTAFVSPTDKYFEITRNLDIFASLFKEINAHYVDEIDPEKSIRTGIYAMLESLDPYTNYIPEEDMDAYRTMTTGEYGGIGALIGYLNNRVVVTMPNEGFPADRAGIKIGDQIIRVNNVNTENKNTQQVSDLLKGKEGTKITVEVKRGEEKLSFDLVREKIVIKNVPYYGMVSGDIGYIKLAEFTTEAATEVRTALINLKKQGAAGIILDVRGNPGGILQEAVAICNLFIPKNKVVVETKGKTPNWNKVYRTTGRPIDTDIPLALLAGSGSASASEIVSGTIQDYDRGVLIGRRTFGKGLVQTTRPLGYNSQLKLTVAKYYTPSGRCIQAIDYTHRNADGSVGKIPDSLMVAFETANGRTVYDGGGITPDLTVEREYWSPITVSLLSKAYIFNFANNYYFSHEAAPDMNTYSISDADYKDFLASIGDTLLSYNSDLENAVANFERAAADAHLDNELMEQIIDLKTNIGHNQENDLQRSKVEIVNLLSEEIVSRYYLQRGEIANSLGHDPDVAKAVEVLHNPVEYNQLLAKKQ